MAVSIIVKSLKKESIAFFAIDSFGIMNFEVLVQYPL